MDYKCQTLKLVYCLQSITVVGYSPEYVVMCYVSGKPFGYCTGHTTEMSPLRWSDYRPKYVAENVAIKIYQSVKYIWFVCDKIYTN